MSTQLDEQFVSAAKEKHPEASYFLDTLANEVRRLETYCAKLEAVAEAARKFTEYQYATIEELSQDPLLIALAALDGGAPTVAELNAEIDKRVTDLLMPKFQGIIGGTDGKS